jgi:tetratricopeptide (TPR) repeat protein
MSITIRLYSSVDAGLDLRSLMQEALSTMPVRFPVQNEKPVLARERWAGVTLEALEIFRLNTLLFPSSWNVYDSYADILAKVGEKQAAILMYEKAAQMNPHDDDGKRDLLRLRTPQ